MSTPLLDSFRFANLRTSLIHHGTNEHGLHPDFPKMESCSTLNGEIFRAFGVDCFGRASQAHGEACDMAKAKADLISVIGGAVFDWQRANWAAHVVRYCDQRETWQGEGERPEKPSPRLPRGTVLNVPATLKALRALRYNCDGGTASGPTVAASLVILDRLIDALKDHCLEMLPEYQAAEWAI